MKEFAIYTGLRLGLFAVTWGAVIGLWILITGEAPLGLTLLVAFLVSGIGSYFVLAAPRERFAQNVQARAERATARFEESRSREDVD